MKVTTVRIEDELGDEVDALARADGASVSEVVRAALHHYIAIRKAEPQTQARLREVLARETEVIERLAAGGSA
ncbi:MAG TPA: ribbon-helix-helix domain-containing protein [Solirubrobacterales bacterium]|nr:ribbon-helix-helix domain-containing protein [Solirubrobacterales bacterium]